MVKRKKKVDTRPGKTNLPIDKKLRAKRPGRRISKAGNRYTETRKNRSDVRGIDLPVKRRKTVSKKRIIMKIGNTRIPLTEDKKRSALAIYNMNEARNFHSENARMLIRLFGTPTQRKKALAIKASHEKRGHITQTESEWLRKFGHSHYPKLLPNIRKKTTTVRRKTGGTVSRRVSRVTSSREPNRGLRRHDLLPLSIRRKLPKLYSQDGKKNPTVFVKFFSPYSDFTWYITEFDGKDTMFGYVKRSGHGSEWGYSSFKELVNSTRGRLPLVERDTSFSPKTISKIRDIPNR